MKKILTIILLLFATTLFSQVIAEPTKKEDKIVKKYKFKRFFKDIFKYSTPYVSYSENNSLQGRQTFYVTQESELIETTVRNPNNFAFNFGIRKIARFSYEDRVNWYDGNESRSVTQNSNVGNVDGLEYLFNISNGRQQSREFTNKQFFIRYVGKHYILKAEHLKNDIVDIEYSSLDARLKLPIGKRLNLSFGAIARTNPIAYGHNPIQKYLEDNAWWTLSYNFANHTDQIYEMIDVFTGESLGYDYLWYDENGVLISSSDEDYRRLHFGRVVNRYNQEELAKIGDFTYLSGVLGLDYYFYRKNVWIHAFANALSYHRLLQGDERYSYDNFIGNDKWIDIQSGIIFGFRINKWFGLFSEYNYQSYWGREIQEIKTGINIKF
tara:strand:+ start:61 stop:1203 length:1143 start_codon:yes stop_codon:yes gene_type:complete